MTLFEILTAMAAGVTAAATMGLLVVAVLAWRKAHETLDAMRVANVAAKQASEAAVAASDAAKEANEQARLDSIRSSRPYVYAELVHSIGGQTTADLRVWNAGQTSAHELSLEIHNWPDPPDRLASDLKDALGFRSMLPPGCGFRHYWRFWSAAGQTMFDGAGNLIEDGTMGMPEQALLTAHYRDSEGRPYKDQIKLAMVRTVTPSPWMGTNPDSGGHKFERRAIALGEALLWHVGELRR